MVCDCWKNLSSEKKSFYIFLAAHLVIWTLVSMIRVVMPTDALEGVYWGSLHDFGTPKHPPLAGWLTYLAYIPFKKDFCVYLMSQTFILFGFIYIYRLAKNFLDDNKAMLSVILLEGCWCYSYITGYYGFNPDVILLFMLPAITFYFYNCVTKDKSTDWIKLGILVGFAFLNKYQTALIILPMLIWAMWFKRDIFKNVYFYIAVQLAFLIFLPHLFWLVEHDFYPVLYFNSELSSSGWLNHITAPLMFLLMQIVVISGTLLIYTIMKLKFKSPFKFVENYDKQQFWFLLLIGFVPLIVHLLMGIFDGGTMRPRWGYEFWFLIGIMLFYFIPTEITQKEFKFTLKSAYVVMLLIFLSLGTLLSVEKNYRSRYPVATVFNDLRSIWNSQFNTEWKYVGGYLEWSLPITIYGETHPMTLLDNHGYPDPWISQNLLRASGAIIIDRTPEGATYYTELSCPYYPEDEIKPVEYKLTVHNALGMPREYTVYYVIVPPMSNWR